MTKQLKPLGLISVVIGEMIVEIRGISGLYGRRLDFKSWDRIIAKERAKARTDDEMSKT